MRRIFVQELCERLIRHAVHVALIYQTLGKERIIREVVNVAFQPAPALCRASTFFPLSTRPRPCFNECKFLLFSSSSLSSFPLTIRTLSRDLRISIYVHILQKIKFPSKPDRRIFHAKNNSRSFSRVNFTLPYLSLSLSFIFSREGCNEVRTREYLGPTIAIPRIGTIRPWPGKRHASDNPISE